LSKLWHVIRSKPNKEAFLAGQLESRNVEFYFPQLKVHPVNPRCRKIKPYFPGYLFIKTDLEINQTGAFERLPGAIGLVLLGGEVAYVPENILSAIHARVDEINDAGGELFETMNKGDRIRIHSGPFEGYEAIFDSRIVGTERVKVFLTMLQKRILPVELPAGFVNRKKATSFSR
jgi:transcription antitermination factor NusG